MNQPQSMDNDADEIQRIANQLGEKWDAVVILCSRHEDGLTRSTFKGSGNWHTQYGMTMEWIETNDERTREETRNGD